MAGGSFQARVGSVTFDGDSDRQYITGNTTFYDLWKIDYTNNSIDSSLLFEGYSTQRITNTLNLVGLDANDRVRLDTSSTLGYQFVLDVTGGDQSVSYVTVSNSNATSNDINTNDSWYGSGTDQGDSSPQWFFSGECSDVASTAWSSASTWTNCGGSFPGPTDTVIIDSHTVTLTAAAQVNDLTISAGELDLASYRIEVGGKWNKSGGTFTPGDGTVLFNSTATDESITSDSSAFNDVYLNDGLVGYWKLDETTVTANVAGALDSSGYGNSGTWNADVRFDGNKPDLNFKNIGSAYFDGTSDLINLGAKIISATGDFTLTVWVYPSSGQQGGTAIMQYGGGQVGRLVLQHGTTTANKFKFFIDNGANDVDFESTNTFLGGGWYFLVGRRTNTVFEIIVDGASEGSDTESGVSVYQGANTIIGIWDGFIDDVRIYDRALSAGEIQLLLQGNQLITGIC